MQQWWRVVDGRELPDPALVEVLLGPVEPLEPAGAPPLQFRNLEGVTPADPVESWGFEGVLSAVERGGPAAWWLVLDGVRRNPGGAVERELREALAIASSPEATADPEAIIVIAEAVARLTGGR